MQSSADEQLIGQCVGEYRIEHLVMQDQLQTIYAIRHLATLERRICTFYASPAHFSPSLRASFVTRFLKEAALLASLDHPHILPICSYGTFADRPYLITPYRVGESLSERSSIHGIYAHSEVQTLLSQLAAGLEYAHARRIVHGGLQPAQIFLSDDGLAQIAGFGLMYMLQRDGFAAAERPFAHLWSVSDTLLIAPEYVAPEVVSGRTVDTRSDIYSMGCILYELLSGRPPFYGDDPLTVAQMHVKEDLPLLSTRLPTLPPVVVSVIQQALERNPQHRFQKIQLLAEAFTQASYGVQYLEKRQQQTSSLSIRPVTAQKTRDWQLVPPVVTQHLPSLDIASISTPYAPRTKLNTARSLTADVMRTPLPDTAPGAVPFNTTSSTAKATSFKAAPPTLPPLVDDTSPLLSTDLPTDFSTDHSDHPSQAAPPSPIKKVRLPTASSQHKNPSLQQILQADDGVGLRMLQDKDGKKRMGRRSMLGLLLAGTIVVGGTAFALSREGAIWQPASTQDQQTSAGAAGQTTTSIYKQTIIGHTQQAKNTAVAFTDPADQRAALLIHLPDGSFFACKRACTHQGVNVNYDGTTQILVCPLHGAVFDARNKGAVLQGPATLPLPGVAIQLNADGTITTV